MGVEFEEGHFGALQDLDHLYLQVSMYSNPTRYQRRQSSSIAEKGT